MPKTVATDVAHARAEAQRAIAKMLLTSLDYAASHPEVRGGRTPLQYALDDFAVTVRQAALYDMGDWPGLSQALFTAFNRPTL